jgi:ATP-dependent Clp protease protease subunit
MDDKTKFYDIQMTGPDLATVFIYGVIGGFNWEKGEAENDAKEFIDEFNAIKAPRINLRFNSPGGSVYHGRPIANAIKASEKEIHGYNDGMAASMAFLIFQMIPAGNRHTAKNALFMAHSAGTPWAAGNAKQLREMADVLEKHDQSFIPDLAEASGKTEEEIKEQIFDFSDHWFTAEEAKEHGFVDIIDDYKSERVPEDAQSMSHDQVVAYFAESPEETTPSAGIIRAAMANIKEKFSPKKEDKMNFEILANRLDQDGPIEFTAEEKTQIRAEIEAATAENPVFTQADIDQAVQAANDEIAGTIEALTTENNDLKEQIVTLKGQSDEPIGDHVPPGSGADEMVSEADLEAKALREKMGIE